MPTLPSATTSVDQTAGAPGAGTSIIAVIAPVPTNDDGVPRQFGSASAIYAFHGYGEGVEYADLHTLETRQPVLFCGIPIAVVGVVGGEDTTGNTGTCVTTVTAGGGGVLHEHDGVVTVLTGGTVGTSQIVIGLSLDGGRTTKRVRIGTASSYAVPYVGVTIAFGAGTLVAGDTIHTWHGSQPLGDSDGFTLARTKLAEQQRVVRTIHVIGDAPDSTYASAVASLANTYASSNERFVKARCQVFDQTPIVMSSIVKRMASGTSVTFAEVGATGDTITRATGSWTTDGFLTGDIITVSNTSGGTNNFTGLAKATVTSATVLTLDTDDLVNQGPITATIVAQGSLTFANSGDTITRNRGSWIADGFKVGQNVTIDGTDSGTNDGTFEITAVSATVLTLATGGVAADEVSGMNDVTVTATMSKATWLTETESAFAAVDSQYRLSLGLGRGRKLSQFSGWFYRRPVQWAASVREYQHDYHIATWKKDEGALDGWSLLDADNNLAELDDRVDGGAGLSARFTTFRSWANGPGGAFIALDLTRAEDATILSYCHNVDVVNLAETTVHRATEAIIGSSIVLKDDGSGHATSDSLATIASQVNGALARTVLVDIGEGVRASGANWVPSSDDVLSGAEAVLTGTLTLTLNGTIHSVSTTIKVQ